MRRRESQPHDAFDFRDGAEQRAEIVSGDGTAIRVDGLPEELDLDAAALDGGTRLGDDVIKRTRDLAAARRRHDAERAVLVAAFDDRDPRLRRRRAIDGEIVVVALVGKIDGDRAIAVDDVIEIADVARSHHEVDPRRALEDPLPFLLRETAGDADLQLGALELEQTELAEAREDFL